MDFKDERFTEAYASFGITDSERERAIYRAMQKSNGLKSYTVNPSDLIRHPSSHMIEQFDETVFRMHLVQKDLEACTPNNITWKWLTEKGILGDRASCYLPSSPMAEQITPVFRLLRAKHLKNLKLDGAALFQLAAGVSVLETAGYVQDPSSVIESEIVSGAKETLSHKGFTPEQIALMGDDAETRKAARILVRARGIQKAP